MRTCESLHACRLAGAVRKCEAFIKIWSGGAKVRYIQQNQANSLEEPIVFEVSLDKLLQLILDFLRLYHNYVVTQCD